MPYSVVTAQQACSTEMVKCIVAFFQKSTLVYIHKCFARVCNVCCTMPYDWLQLHAIVMLQSFSLVVLPSLSVVVLQSLSVVVLQSLSVVPQLHAIVVHVLPCSFCFIPPHFLVIQIYRYSVIFSNHYS